ncbi:MAG: 3-dehydroquinate synthase family protein [Myxococcota bacterium]
MAQAPTPPGAYVPAQDVWGRFEDLVAELPEGTFVLVDERVQRLHPKVTRALKKRKPLRVVALKAGENVKTVTRLQTVATAAHALKRSGLMLCIGGGTVGDLGTVAAHLIKRGVPLIHVPTTLLAAVDSSVGGKGALHVGRVKNALGAFHYPVKTWICPELFETLAPAQIREGITEAWKMFACLDAARFQRFREAAPALPELIRDARSVKERVCAVDPYDATGVRAVLNFGHTFGHVIETLSRFRVSHGDAVGLGIRCALDVGHALGVTNGPVRDDVEGTLERCVGILPRERLARVLSSASAADIRHVLLADKKGADAAAVKMVLLRDVGATVSMNVPTTTWMALLPAWRKGVRP